jgi:hypothetical protein
MSPELELPLTLLVWIIVAGLCGVLPLGLAGLLGFFAYRRRVMQSAVHQASHQVITKLKLGPKLVRVEGTIDEVPKPLSSGDLPDLAILRLEIEEFDDENGWEAVTTRMQTTPFVLKDTTGSILVDPARLDQDLLGDGLEPTARQGETDLRTLGFPADTGIQVAADAQVRLHVWELRQGQCVTVIGTVQERSGVRVIASVADQPLIVSALDEPSLEVHTNRQAIAALVGAILLALPGLCMLLVAISEAMEVALRLLGP